MEGFGAARLKAAQAKLAAAGGLTLSKDIKQDNILNLPLPDFEIEGELARPLGAPLLPNCRLPACMQGLSAELFHVGISISACPSLLVPCKSHMKSRYCTSGWTDGETVLGLSSCSCLPHQFANLDSALHAASFQ